MWIPQAVSSDKLVYEITAFMDGLAGRTGVLPRSSD